MMELTPKKGIANLLFGMKQADVEAVIGKPDFQFKDEEKNVIYVYNAPKLRLTFYEDEGFRFGYVICANPEVTLFGNRLLSRAPSEILSELPQKAFAEWETERFDLATNHFNEANWLILQEEFGSVSKVEMGAVINAKDELEWAFK